MVIPVPLHVPPEGEPVRLVAGVFRQKGPLWEIVTFGLEVTVTIWLCVPVQPPLVILYVMVCVPGPALAGVNTVPDTPGPENVPPGVTGTSVDGASPVHAVDGAVKLAFGCGVTVTVIWFEPTLH